MVMYNEIGVKEEKVYEYCKASGKRCYTQKDASATLNNIKSRHNRKIHNGKVPRRSYFCSDCGFYHLTHFVLPDNQFKKKRVIKVINEQSSVDIKQYL